MANPLDFLTFTQTLAFEQPETHWPNTLKALWYDGKSDWHKAHDLVEGLNDPSAKWVHAYLHRKEGDDWNANYWYRQAGKTFPKSTLEKEYQHILAHLLAVINNQ